MQQLLQKRRIRLNLIGTCSNGEAIEARAGVTITDVATITLTATADSKFLIADLP
jgi:hypothetical protein